MISEDRLSHCSISSVERTIHKICVLFCRKVAEKTHIEMLMKTVYRTVLSHLWTEIFSKIAFFFFCRKVAERKHRKILFANFNFSILGGSVGTFFLLLFRRKQYTIFVNTLMYLVQKMR